MSKYLIKQISIIRFLEPSKLISKSMKSISSNHLLSRFSIITIFLLSIHCSAAYSQSNVIWSDNLSVPANWTIGNLAGNSDNWVIGTTPPSGTFPLPVIASPTAANGFALFDSDLLCSGNQNAFFKTSQPIDLSGATNVLLVWKEHYQKYFDSTFVEVSLDNNIWQGLALHTNLNDNAVTTNPLTYNVDLSSLAGFAQVWLRFRFYSNTSVFGPTGGCGYSWQIDDIVIYDSTLAIASEPLSFGGIGRGDVQGSVYSSMSGNQEIVVQFNDDTICAGESFYLNYYSSGIYNANNSYTVELSDAAGNFSNPTVIGTLPTSSNQDSIQLLIPPGTLGGNAYRFRILSSSPAFIGDTSIVITVLPQTVPQISIANNSTAICSGVPVIFTATGTNLGDNPSYEWYVNGTPAGINDSTFSLTSLQTGDTIFCVVFGSLPCQVSNIDTSNYFIANVLPVVVPAVSISANQNPICEGEPVLFVANATNGGSSPTVQWLVDGNSVFINGLTFAAPSLPNNSIVSCVLSSSEICATPASVPSNDLVLGVLSNNFNLGFTVSATTLNAPPYEVTFTNTTPNPTDYAFTWIFGDGVTTNSIDATHTYVSSGIYTVSLKAVQLSTGCSQIFTFSTPITVNIGNDPCIFTIQISPSGSVFGCDGGFVEFSATTNALNPLYQWMRDGILIGGATQSTYTATINGNYSVVVYQGGNCPQQSQVVSATFNGNATPQPTITTSGLLYFCGQGSMTLTAIAIGAQSFLWNTGETNDSITITQSGSYFVTATYGPGCQSVSIPLVVNASYADNPGLCMITVDTLTNSNYIVWETPLVNNVDSFFVYKETSVASVYAKIGAVAYNELSEFNDINSNPQIQAYRYRIVALDTCGAITPPSDFHKTIHLIVFPGIGSSRQLSWSHYEGIPFPSYEILRRNPGGQFQVIATIASNLNSYTDLNPPSLDVEYRVDIVLADPCESIDRATYNKSKSNVGNNQGILPDVGIQEKSLWGNLKLMPNPNNGESSIQWLSQLQTTAMVEVFNSVGQITERFEVKVNPGLNVFNLTNQESGFYLVRLYDLETKSAVSLRMVVR
jgi:hypothetical protein